MTQPSAYRRGVGIVLIDRRKQIFVGRRIDTPEAWQMPQGGIDGDEEPRDAALRELEEEVGTRKAELVAETKGWHRYDLPRPLQGAAWGGSYRGQEQKWFAMRFLGTDRDIRLDRHKPEFDAWRWAGRDEVLTLIVPFKRALYAAVLGEFAPFLA